MGRPAVRSTCAIFNMEQLIGWHRSAGSEDKLSRWQAVSIIIKVIKPNGLQYKSSTCSSNAVGLLNTLCYFPGRRQGKHVVLKLIIPMPYASFCPFTAKYAHIQIRRSSWLNWHRGIECTTMLSLFRNFAATEI